MMLRTDHDTVALAGPHASRSVLLIHHGESTFNAVHRETGVDPLHVDARLSGTGLAEVAIDLGVTSPLTRCSTLRPASQRSRAYLSALF